MDPQPALNLDAPYDDFMSQLNSRRWNSAELLSYRAGLQTRIEQITRQLEDSTNQSRGTTWRNSVETAKKYFTKKLNALTAHIPSHEFPQARKTAGGHGFLVTFLINGEHIVVATKRNPSELWADMLADTESDEDKAQPALIAFLNLSDDAARRLPESLWVDDL